jgi:hypothetical protein
VTEACLIDIWIPEFDIDEMPAPGRLVTDLRAEAIGVPISVGPGCLTCDVMRRQIIGVGGEKRADLGACCRIEKPLGN